MLESGHRHRQRPRWHLCSWVSSDAHLQCSARDRPAGLRAVADHVKRQALRQRLARKQESGGKRPIDPVPRAHLNVGVEALVIKNDVQAMVAVARPVASVRRAARSRRERTEQHGSCAGQRPDRTFGFHAPPVELTPRRQGVPKHNLKDAGAGRDTWAWQIGEKHTTPRLSFPKSFHASVVRTSLSGAKVITQAWTEETLLPSTV